jgi:hypothetical protein
MWAWGINAIPSVRLETGWRKGISQIQADQPLEVSPGFPGPRCSAEMDTLHGDAVGAAQDLHAAVMTDMLPALQVRRMCACVYALFFFS